MLSNWSRNTNDYKIHCKSPAIYMYMYPIQWSVHVNVHHPMQSLQSHDVSVTTSTHLAWALGLGWLAKWEGSYW